MRLQSRTLLATVITAATLGCSDGTDPIDASLPRTVSLADGYGQEGAPGVELPEPFVVRVGTRSRGVANVVVTWRVESGAGTFYPSSTSITDADGLARVRFTPGTHRVTVVAETDATTIGSPVRFLTVPQPIALYPRVFPPDGCGRACERYVFYPDGTFAVQYPGVSFEGTAARADSVVSLSFSSTTEWRATATIRGDTLSIRYNDTMHGADFEDSDFVLDREGPLPPWVAARIELLTGNEGRGTSGTLLPEQLAVRVTNTDGIEVRGTQVTWSVSAGAGDFWHALDSFAALPVSRSDAAGVARISFRPLVPGISEVTATVGPGILPVRFRSWSEGFPAVIIRFGPLFDCSTEPNPNDPSEFTGPNIAPVGSMVEWVFAEGIHPSCRAQIASLTVPAGVAQFRSGLLKPGDRFSMVVKARGDWIVGDVINGGFGKVRVQ